MGVLIRRRAAWARTLVVLGAVTMSLASAPAGAQSDPLKALDEACRARMQTLSEVEAANLERIEWDVVAGGVRGTYIGYARNFTCRRSEPPREPPTARLGYQEVVYQLSGESVREARAAVPKPLEIREVTVVLVYRDGRWW